MPLTVEELRKRNIARRKQGLRAAQNEARPLIRRAVARNTPRKSGDLMNSTQVAFTGTEGRIVQRFYGEFVNFGTRRIAARRYIEKTVGNLRMATQLANIRKRHNVDKPFRLTYFGRVVGGG